TSPNNYDMLDAGKSCRLRINHLILIKHSNHEVMMKFTNLSNEPDKYSDTIKLIEKSFNYQSPNSFAVDFYPLMSPTNRRNCHIIIDNDSVIGHIGVMEKQFSISTQSFSILMMGGIAIDEAHRGLGLYKKLMQYVLSTYPSHAFY